jgi:hypothetical protein
LHNKKLHNIYSSSNIIRVTTSKSTKGLGYVAEMGTELHTKFVVKNLRE